MPKHRILITIGFVFALSLFSAPVLRADSISLTDLGVDNAEGQVSVGFSIVVNDMAPLLDALQNGGQFQVRCSAKLYQRRIGFWDTFLAETEYVSDLVGKPIARECMVTDQRGAHTFDFSELQHELDRFWSRLSLPMIGWESVERGKAYRVVLKFSVTRTNVPGWVSKPLFFVSWDLVPEVSYVLDFDF
jgi:hypothetical protein